MFSCGFYQIFRNICFAEYLWTAASEVHMFEVPTVSMAFLTESFVVEARILFFFFQQFDIK